jgi:hypothetical protein
MRKALLLLALATACSGGSTIAARTPPPSASPIDPFDAIAPPTSPGVGSFDAILANHAYAATQGFLALELLEQSSVTGSNSDALVEQLQGAVQDSTVKADLGGSPTRRGLDYRPLFPKGATVPKPVGTVSSSTYTADEVKGLGGENGIRVTWTGTVIYPVTVAGKTSSVPYTLTMSYVFSRVANDPSGLVMQQVVKGTSSFTGVIDACAAKGVLYPGSAAAPCPV